MNGHVIKSINSDKNLQICICGVAGAGKKTVASLLFPGRVGDIQEINWPKNKKSLMIIILDGVHQQNLEEERIFEQLAKLQKKMTHKNMKTLFVLNKIDLFTDNLPLSKSIRQMYESYKIFSKQKGVFFESFIPFSAVAAQLCKMAEAGILTEYDNLNVKILLRKIGRSFSSDLPNDELLGYIISHKKQLKTLSGKLLIEQCITKWRKEK